MRNLKRALSLALAAIMIIGMMVVGASAVDYKDFTDNGDIVNRDAVTMLTTLGVIDGKPDGTYAPTELVTRDQMAKMISVILNQGADVNDVYSNLDSGLTDISTNWAKGHINYCYTLGVIAGRGDGTFDPGANVTAAEAAKMLLVAAGYDPATEGFVGAQWSWNVNAKASSLGIYKNYTKGVLEPLNRDDAALLIYNALDIERIERYENGYARVYNDNRTILSSLYGVYKMVGVVTGNEWARLEGSGIDDALAAGKTTVSNPKILASDTLQTQILGSDNVRTRQFNVSTDEELLGKAVTMFIRKETVLNNIEVLGVVLNEDLNTVVTLTGSKSTISGALKDTGLSVRDTGTDATQYYVNYGYEESFSDAQGRLGLTGTNANGNGIVMEIIDNDDDGVVDYVLYKREDMAVVSKLSKDGTEITLRGINDNDAIKFEDVVTDMDVELDDVLLVISYGGRYYISAPQIVTGEMNSYTAKKETEQSIEVDGVDYKPSAIGKLDSVNTSANGVSDIIDLDILLCEKETGVNFDITYDFYLDSNGFMRAFRPTEQSRPSYALVLNSGYDPGVYSSEASGKVTVLLADGTEGTYPINFSTSAANLAKQLGYKDGASWNGVSFTKSQLGVIELKAFLGTDYTDNSPTRPWRNGASTDSQFAYKNNDNTGSSVDVVDAQDYRAGQAAGYVVQYTLNESGVMTIKYVMGSVDGYNVNNDYLANGVTNPEVKTISTKQGTLSDAYSTGATRVYWQAGRSVTVDQSTVAFYYDEVEAADLAAGGKYANRADEVDEGDVLYGVAVGYSNMAPVSKGAGFMSSIRIRTGYDATNKATTYDYTNLADVILFDEANIITARDYAFVLSTNKRDANNIILNVLFEDGKAGTLTITRSNYENVIVDADGFEKAYAYTIDANDKATLYEGDAKFGHIFRLDNQTVAVGSNENSYPYNINNVKIWDVTGASAGDDGVALKNFTYLSDNIQLEGYLILDTKGEVRTAFVRETTETGGSTGHNHDWDSWRVPSDADKVYSAAAMQNAVNDGKSVEVYGDVNVGNLYIPEGCIVRAHDDFTATRVYGPGKLWVMGDVTMPAGSSLETNARIDGDMNLGGNAQLAAIIRVSGDVVASSDTLTIATAGDVHILGDYTDGTAAAPTGILTVNNSNGHIEIGGNAIVGTANVYSKNTLIVTGNLTTTTLNIGDTKNEGRVVVGSAKVTTLNMAKDHATLIQNKDTGAVTVVTTLDAQEGTTLNVKGLVVDGATTVTLAGSTTIDVLNMQNTTVTVTAKATGTIGKINNDLTSNPGKLANSSEKLVIEDKASGVVVEDKLNGSNEGTVQIGDNSSVTVEEGKSASTGDLDVSNTGASVTVAEKADLTVNGDLSLGSAGTVTVSDGATLTLTGGATSAADATEAGINIDEGATLKVENGSSTTAVDVALITPPTNPVVENGKIKNPATVTFASNAKLTNVEAGKFFEKDGTQITNAEALVGRTFVLDSSTNFTGRAAREGEQYVWVATSEVVTPAEEAILTEAMLSATTNDYVNGEDTEVKAVVSGKTITVNNVNVKDSTTRVLLTIKANGLTISPDATVSMSNGVITADPALGSFTVTVSGTGLKTNVYTVKMVKVASANP